MAYTSSRSYQTFENLEIWQLGHNIVLKTYQYSHSFPKEEIYGLTNQLRRAAVSVPANIAEGYGRRSKKEFSQYLVISLGSLEEIRYYFILATQLKYMSEINKNNLIEDINRLKAKLNAFRNSIST